jgi:hypothetical protein
MQVKEFQMALEKWKDSLWRNDDYLHRKLATNYVINDTLHFVTWEIDIIYSTIWTVPIPYFRGFDSSGELISETIQTHLFSNQVFKVSFIVLFFNEEHPIKMTMWFYIHPCSLHEILEALDHPILKLNCIINITHQILQISDGEFGNDSVKSLHIS